MRFPLPRDLLKVVAAALVVFAGLWALAWWRWSWADQLAPNVVTESLGIALTLTLIDALFQRRDRLRVAPLVEDAIDEISLYFRHFVYAIAIRYDSTHAGATRLPRTSLAILDRWLEDEDRLIESQFFGSGIPVPIRAGDEFAEKAQRVVEANRHDLGSEFTVAARRTFVKLNISSIDAAPSTSTGRDLARVASSLIVRAMREFADALESKRAGAADFDVGELVDQLQAAERIEVPTSAQPT